jgi:hypothetical protein
VRPVLLSLLLLAVPPVAWAASRDAPNRRGMVAGPALNDRLRRAAAAFGRGFAVGGRERAELLAVDGSG